MFVGHPPERAVRELLTPANSPLPWSTSLGQVKLKQLSLART
jgi:hypothetical protein